MIDYYGESRGADKVRQAADRICRALSGLS